VVIDAPEILRSKQTYTFGKTGDGLLPLGTDGQFLTASGPAARDYRPSVLRFHAGQEAMRLGAMAIIRLKGAFRHFISRNQYTIVAASNPAPLPGQFRSIIRQVGHASALLQLVRDLFPS
jgi:hypothetical protein